MPKKSTQWPMLSVSDADFEIIKELRNLPGVFRSAEARDILMTAAAIGVKNKLPADMQAKTTGNDIMNGPTLGSEPLSQYRQLMILMFYLTRIESDDLAQMSNTKEIVENFKDYAHRGLLYLRDIYKEQNGNERLLKQYEDALNIVSVKLKEEAKI